MIDNGQVFAVGQGGRMVALELTTGQRMWELNIAGIDTPWVAGDWIFVITDDAKLLCISRQNGHIRWINQLPAVQSRRRRKKGEIEYSGPVLAGGRLIVTGSTGVVVNVDPTTGSFQSQTNVGAPVSLSPVVANSTLYVLRRQRPAEPRASPLRVTRAAQRGDRASSASPRRLHALARMPPCRDCSDLHASAHRRHHRPAERRKIDAVQPARRASAWRWSTTGPASPATAARARRSCSGSTSG